MTQLGFDGRPPQGLPFLNSLWLNSVHPFLLHLFYWSEGGCRLQSVGSNIERQSVDDLISPVGIMTLFLPRLSLLLQSICFLVSDPLRSPQFLQLKWCTFATKKVTKPLAVFLLITYIFLQVSQLKVKENMPKTCAALYMMSATAVQSVCL